MTQTGTLKDSGAQVIDMTYAQRGEAGNAFPEPVSDGVGVRPSVAVFANRPRVRSEICDDLTGAGFRTLDNGPVDVLVDGPITLMGDVVMVDCPSVDGAVLASLSRLDQRVARTGAHLIVSTTLDALDDVFAALDQSHPQILVQPSRAERIIAVGRVMADMSSSRVREMSDEDRLNLLYLSRQVEAIAHKLEGLSDHSLKSGTALSGGVQEVKTQSEQLSNEKPGTPAYNSSRPRLPDPGFVRRVIDARQARAKFFDAELFADPAWDMLLDLTAAHGENIRVSVTSFCIAASVPATTALRWLKQMVDCGIFERIADPSDKRRAFIALSSTSLEGMARYFEEVEIPLANSA